MLAIPKLYHQETGNFFLMAKVCGIAYCFGVAKSFGNVLRFSLTIPSGTLGIDNVISSYFEERASEYAAIVTIKFTEALVNNVPYNLYQDVACLHQIREDEHIGPSTN